MWAVWKNGPVLSSGAVLCFVLQQRSLLAAGLTSHCQLALCAASYLGWVCWFCYERILWLLSEMTVLNRTVVLQYWACIHALHVGAENPAVEGHMWNHVVPLALLRPRLADWGPRCLMRLAGSSA